MEFATVTHSYRLSSSSSNCCTRALFAFEFHGPFCRRCEVKRARAASRSSSVCAKPALMVCAPLSKTKMEITCDMLRGQESREVQRPVRNLRPHESSQSTVPTRFQRSQECKESEFVRYNLRQLLASPRRKRPSKRDGRHEPRVYRLSNSLLVD